ncbi:MAG: phosphatase PAP2 family protein [Bacilli bacterium]|nr:phosphatase PAP2 family protein [Bacilli bacterium]
MKKGMISIGIAIILLLAFCTILYLVWTKKVDQIDKAVYGFISKLITPKNTKIMKFLTFFGGTIGIALSLFVSYFFIKDNFDRGFITLGILGEVALNNIIKIIIKRFRPTINPLVIETGYSFPSGHTMSSTAFYSLLLFFIWKSSLSMTIKIIISIPCIIMIFSVLISRVYLGVHYISDVTAGLCLSLSYVLLITFFYTSLRNYFI